MCKLINIYILKHIGSIYTWLKTDYSETRALLGVCLSLITRFTITTKLAAWLVLEHWLSITFDDISLVHIIQVLDWKH